MKFSVIIPYARAETTIGECLDSVVRAVDRLDSVSPDCGAEIVCVNGGCPDRTPSIVEAYARGDRRFVSIGECPNETGAGPARNMGIDHARGEYLVFVDADDTIDPDAFVNLKDATADVVTYLPPQGSFDFNEDDPAVRAQSLRATFSPMVGNLLVWNAIYRRETIGDWRFVNLMPHDDLVWTCGAYARAKTVVAGVSPWYHYNRHVAGSAVNSHSWKRVHAAWRATSLMWRAVRPCFRGASWILRMVMARKMAMHLLLHCLKEIPLALVSSLHRQPQSVASVSPRRAEAQGAEWETSK